jgi:hypothetical protein
MRLPKLARFSAALAGLALLWAQGAQSWSNRLNVGVIVVDDPGYFEIVELARWPAQRQLVGDFRQLGVTLLSTKIVELHMGCRDVFRVDRPALSIHLGPSIGPTVRSAFHGHP